MSTMRRLTKYAC